LQKHITEKREGVEIFAFLFLFYDSDSIAIAAGSTSSSSSSLEKKEPTMNLKPTAS
jgi:hypothetical protein